MISRRRRCRACASTALTPVLSLGDQFIASNFSISKEFPPVDRRIPLDLVRCNPELDEDACGLVQLRHTVPSDLMYASYGYRSGINETMAKHLGDLARSLERRLRLGPGDVVVDIGANDGTLLKQYETNGAVYVGFEPSDIEPETPIPHVRFIKDYFSAAALRDRVQVGKVKAITSIAMFYDLDEPNSFVADIAELLAQDGLWVLELSYLPSMLELNSFDTICHEHLEYYSLGVLERLLMKHGLAIADAELNDVNGGSVRVYACHRGSRHAERTVDVRGRLYALKRRECELKLDMPDPYLAFAERIAQAREELRALLIDLKKTGKVVHGYGASTKGNVILQYADIGTDLVAAIADRNPSKWNRHTPGTNIPIISEEDMRTARPDYLLALPWHFLASFSRREAEFLNRGGKFIVPLPRPRIVG